MRLSLFARRFAGLVLPGIAALLPPLVVLAPLGTAPVLIVAALAAAVSAPGRILHTAKEHAAPLALLLAAIGLWAIVSALWSVIPAHSALEGLRFLGESVCGLAVLGAAWASDTRERERIGRALAAGAVIALAILAVERFGDEPIMHWWHGSPASVYEPLTRFDRGVTVLVLLLWPLLLARFNLVLRLALAGLIIAASFVMTSAAAMTAALASLCVFALAWLAPRFVAGLMTAGLIAFGVVMPIATPSYHAVEVLHEQAPWIKWSGIHRLLIWRFSADRVAERPFLGWGMDASRAVPGGRMTFNELVPGLHYPSPAEALPLHPHDAALQWQLELGIPGLLMGLAVVTWVICRIGWSPAFSRERRAGALALTAAVIVIGLLSFGIWQAWWLSTIWLAAALFTALSGDARDRDKTRPRL